MIGGVIMAHGDDKGLVLPPALAPHQVVIVPIARGDPDEAVLAAARDLARRLSRTDIRVHVDDRTHLSPGFKFNHWELRGVPIRLELGPRDLAAGTVLMARRLSYDRQAVGSERAAKEPLSLDSALARLSFELTAVQAMLLHRATDFRDQRTVRANSWPDFTAAVAVGWALALPCADPACEDEIKAETRPRRAASRWTASRSRAPASAAGGPRPTASG